jgi:gas vesicle protein
MKTTLGLLAGAGLGAGLMYLFDPYEGPRRRQQLADAASHAAESTGETLGNAWETVSERAAEAGSALASHLPDASDLRKHGRRWMSGAGETAQAAQERARGWMESARSALPSRPRLRRPTDISGTSAALGGLSVAALSIAATWLFDPNLGRSRRAWLAQKATRALNETGDFMRATGRHLRNRAKGVYYETRSAAEETFQNISGREECSEVDQSTLNQGATSI